MQSDREHRYASHPDSNVVERYAILVREHIEHTSGRYYSDLLRKAYYGTFFDLWYHHWLDDVNGTPETFESWFECPCFEFL